MKKERDSILIEKADLVPDIIMNYHELCSTCLV